MKALIVCLVMLLVGQLAYAQRQVSPEAIRKFKEKHPKADVEKLLEFSEKHKRKWEKIMLLYFFGHKVKLQHIKKDIIERSIDDITPEEIYQRI